MRTLFVFMLIAALLFLPGFIGAQTLNTPQNTSFLTLKVDQISSSVIRLSIDQGGTLDGLTISEYLGSGTDNRILLGSGSKDLSQPGRWVFDWDTTNVTDGSHRVFAIGIIGSTRVDGQEVLISVDKSTPPSSGSSGSSGSGSSVSGGANTPSTPPPTVSGGSVAGNTDELTDIINISNSSGATVISVDSATPQINQISSDIANATTGDSGLVTKAQEEADDAITTIIDQTSEIEEALRRSIVTGDVSSAQEKKEILITTTAENLDNLVDLAKEAGIEVDTKAIEDALASDLLALEIETAKKRLAFEERGGLLLYIDSDSDSVSDYDEINIYLTDPENSDSDNDGVEDGAEIVAGRNPRQSIDDSIEYEDPRVVGEETLSLSVVDISVVETDTVDGVEIATKIRLSGSALPNSYVTLFIYSSPITVTVKTDNSGKWEYTLDKELSDGSHEVYVATVDNSGKILAKSSGVPFVKQAAAVEIGFILDTSGAGNPSFFSPFFIVGVILVLILISVFVIVIVGHSNKAREQELQKMGGGDDSINSESQ
tara:strand:- start:8 stop:1639 length:1632 start_codon:yes stop_codon:yes gene_type:complete